MNPKLIYIDVCSLSRAFDDQDYLRIRMETDAVTLILSRARQGIYRLVTSPVHLIEINATEDPFERIQLLTLLEKLRENTNVDMMETRKRAEELVNLGFGIADAAHVAFAERSGADL
jgi:predicted nucleic acid-binding protein